MLKKFLMAVIFAVGLILSVTPEKAFAEDLYLCTQGNYEYYLIEHTMKPHVYNGKTTGYICEIKEVRAGKAVGLYVYEFFGMGYSRYQPMPWEHRIADGREMEVLQSMFRFLRKNYPLDY